MASDPSQYGRGSGSVDNASVGFGRGSSGADGTGRGGSGEGSSSRAGRRGGPRKDYGTIHRDLYTRPEGLDKKGTHGDRFKFNVNFVKLVSEMDNTIYQYHVGFEPEIDSKQMRIEIVRNNCVNVTGKHVVFDGMIMYVPKEISGGTNEQMVQHPLTRDPVKVTFRQSVTFGRNDPQAINIYNLLVREAFKSINYVQVQRNFFDPSRSHTVAKFDVEVWPGYETAVRMYEEDLMLCIENRFKVLRRQTVYAQMMAEYQRSNNNMDLLRSNCDHTFTGQTVLTLYNNRMHRLSKFAWDMNPTSTFHHAASNREMTFVEYFKQQYNVSIKDHCQPLIISEGKPKQPGEDPQITYLVPELCNVTGLTDSMRKDARTMKELSSFTRLSPDQRRDTTMAFLHAVASSAKVSDELKAWNVELDTKLVEMECRRLPPETLYGKNPQGTGYQGRNAEWAKDVKGAGNFRTESLTDWILLCPDSPEYFKEAFKFIEECSKIGKAMGMHVEDPFKWAVSDPDANIYFSACMAGLQEFKAKKGRSAKMVIVLVNDDNKTRYDVIKKLLCHDMPVPSQIVQLQTLSGRYGENKNYSSIVLKILLQINCKMGGAIWKVKIPLQNAMIVGYDLYHDSTMKGKTVGACVTSYDQDYTRWFSQTEPHANPTELGDNLRKFMKRALEKYYESNNNALPERLFVYRDGCGDGQIPLVRDNEVRQVKEACDEVGRALGTTYKPKLAFTVITKKVNMRVFRQLGGPQKLTNPEPGTVVDSVVTRPERYDFYLVPQFVNQGTVTPVCYNILHDDTGLTPDVHQRLAFKLCHLYYNWQGTVRVPAPCQYAHKLAFLVAQSLHKQSSDELRDRLFFL